MLVYPNPVNELLNIDLGERYDEVNIRVMNISGKIVIIQTFNQKQILELDLITLPDGIYFVNIMSEEKSATIKLVKKR